ncbi:MAG: hypothetical protein ACJAT6_000096 [Akkermansiaceae bacterium]|jgi:hypothetical protein
MTRFSKTPLLFFAVGMISMGSSLWGETKKKSFNDFKISEEAKPLLKAQ